VREQSSRNKRKPTLTVPKANMDNSSRKWLCSDELESRRVQSRIGGNKSKLAQLKSEKQNSGCAKLRGSSENPRFPISSINSKEPEQASLKIEEIESRVWIL
jgi:hypothetical protein